MVSHRGTRIPQADGHRRAAMPRREPERLHRLPHRRTALRRHQPALPIGGPVLTPHQAWLRAAGWGSYIRPGDTGACMYGFNERGVVQSEAHRQACLFVTSVTTVTPKPAN